MKINDLWSPMSDLTQAQKDVSNSVVGGSLALLGIVMVAAMPLAAQAQRMGTYGQQTGGGYSLPQRPAPAPTPAPQPTYQPPAPQPTYQPPAPLPQPQQPLLRQRRPLAPRPQQQLFLALRLHHYQYLSPRVLL